MNEPGGSSVIRDYFATQKGQELKKWIDDNLKANAQNENAMRILKEAIQAAANDPLMTPEVKELADMIVFLIEDREPFKYDFDAVLKPVIKIAKAEGRDIGGKTRAENDKRTAYLNEIEEEAISRATEFRRHGYQAEFVREMLNKYPNLKDEKAILKRLGKLKKSNSIEKLNIK
ncbi:hypothetical protein C8R26_1303 [Nitrosomonas oligotropha]|uniref:Uncharacterized protein n=2 Tax=Nitrosomonas oligotropha TaxID=42354 RepID=A0A2T5HIL0_9PROT|nr:hypothetical protein C8R26_1303 [Nitrosomonas oligotropha]